MRRDRHAALLAGASRYAHVYGALESVGEGLRDDAVAGSFGPAPHYRRRSRTLLDAAPWDARERARGVAEVRNGFELTIAMLDELADTVGLRAAAAG